MRIFVSGASGFVGRLLCTSATTQGVDVIASDRRPLDAAIGARQVVKDMRDISVADLGSGVDAVIHLATGKREYVGAASSTANPLRRSVYSRPETAVSWQTMGTAVPGRRRFPSRQAGSPRSRRPRCSRMHRP